MKKQALLICLLGCLGMGTVCTNETKAQTPTFTETNSASALAEKKEAISKDKTWQLSLDKETRSGINLLAKDAPLSAIVEDLAQQSGVTIQLSPTLQKQAFSGEIKDAAFESALMALAPLVYVDEIITISADGKNELLGVYLAGLNEAAPSKSTYLKSDTESFVFMGEISEGAELSAKKEAPLKIKVENGRISIKAHKQPKVAVIYEIAQQFGISFELQQVANDLIDLDLQDYRIEDALRQLALPLRLAQRRILPQLETEPFRLVLIAKESGF